jgi:hypothetical protein
MNGWHPCRGAGTLGCGFPVVSLRSTTGYGLASLRDAGGVAESADICGHLRLRIESRRRQRVLTAEGADDRRLGGGRMGRSGTRGGGWERRIGE